MPQPACYFRKFVEETDPDVREKILEIVPEETRRALQAQWSAREERIQEHLGKQHETLGSEGRTYTEEDLEAYSEAKTQLGLGDWLRSRDIASFFFKHGFALPDPIDSAVLNDALDYQDVKLKIVQQEGYDAHDFNLFDDRSSVLWRKPYADGAVRKLTRSLSPTATHIPRARAKTPSRSTGLPMPSSAKASLSTRPRRHGTCPCPLPHVLVTTAAAGLPPLPWIPHPGSALMKNFAPVPP